MSEQPNRPGILGYYGYHTDGSRSPCFWTVGEPVRAITADGAWYYNAPGHDHEMMGVVAYTLAGALDLADQIYAGRNFRPANPDGSDPAP